MSLMQLRRPSLSLRTSLLLIAIVGLLFAWPGRWIAQRLVRRHAIASIVSHGGSVQFGDRGYAVVFGKADAGNLRALPDAGALDLVGSSVTDADLAALRDFPSLRLLNLTNCRITDAGLAHLKNLTNLEYLLLGGTGVTDEGLKHLSGLHRLQILLLDDTRVSNEGLTHLKGMDVSHRTLAVWDVHR